MAKATRTDCEEANGDRCLPSHANERDELILKHLSQVRLIARRVQDRLPPSVKLEDLVSAGIVGLISAIDHYDAAHSVKLRTYAEHKIKGAILDFLREMDSAPRHYRKRSREIEAVVTALEQTLQRAPSTEEIARCLGLSVTDYQNLLFGLQMRTRCESDQSSRDEEGSTRLREIADPAALVPFQIAETAEMQRVLNEALQRMPHPRTHYSAPLLLRRKTDARNCKPSRST